MTDYLTSCPGCGQELTPHAGDTQSTPWVCNICHLGFWVAELAPGTRAHYRPQHRDFGHGPHMADLRIARAVEQRNAELRGSSARDDQLGQLHVTVLQQVVKRKLDPNFHGKVQEAIAAKTPKVVG